MTRYLHLEIYNGLPGIRGQTGPPLVISKDKKLAVSNLLLIAFYLEPGHF